MSLGFLASRERAKAHAAAKGMTYIWLCLVRQPELLECAKTRAGTAKGSGHWLACARLGLVRQPALDCVASIAMDQPRSTRRVRLLIAVVLLGAVLVTSIAMLSQPAHSWRHLVDLARLHSSGVASDRPTRPFDADDTFWPWRGREPRFAYVTCASACAPSS